MSLTPLSREKLIVALQVTDAVEHFNTALRARKAVLSLDYRDGITPKLTLSMPGSKPEVWMSASPRKRRCVACIIADPSLQAIATDISQRLALMNCYLAIGTIHPPNQKITAKAQVFFRDAKRTAITLCAVSRGGIKSHDQFLLPKPLA